MALASDKAPTTSALDVSGHLKRVIEHEAQGLMHASAHLPDGLALLTEQIIRTSGRLIFSGMGKSGHIAKKLSATFSSVGIRSFFLHPTEALHGDLGMVAAGDVCIVLSKSGSGSDLAMLLPHLKHAGVTTVLLTCQNGSLSSHVDQTIILPFLQEACPQNLVPSTSSTLMLAVGDAIAIVASAFRGLSAQDFARNHPGGSLGNSLLLSVSALMTSGEDLPMLGPDESFRDVLMTITRKKKGVAIVAKEGRLLGMITDGDLRRACDVGEGVFEKTAKEIMTVMPHTIGPTARAADALRLMEAKSITSLVVTQDNRVMGLVHLHDILKAGIKR